MNDGSETGLPAQGDLLAGLPAMVWPMTVAVLRFRIRISGLEAEFGVRSLYGRGAARVFHPLPLIRA